MIQRCATDAGFFAPFRETLTLATKLKNAIAIAGPTRSARPFVFPLLAVWNPRAVVGLIMAVVVQSFNSEPARVAVSMRPLHEYDPIMPRLANANAASAPCWIIATIDIVTTLKHLAMDIVELQPRKAMRSHPVAHALGAARSKTITAGWDMTTASGYSSIAVSLNKLIAAVAKKQTAQSSDL